MMSPPRVRTRTIWIFFIIFLALVACDQSAETGSRSGGITRQPLGSGGTITDGGQVPTGSGGRMAMGGQMGDSLASGGQLGLPERDAGMDTPSPVDTRPDVRQGTDTRLDTPSPTNTGVCEFLDPPANVSAWVEESWNSQLGSNVKSRKAWLLDSVMLGKGQINLCVRWGASTAPTSAVKTGMASAVQRWFNDWFQVLGSYGCFPYGIGNVVAKVTGWAVKPGNTDWVADLGPDVKVYTETDGEGEPKCPDSCSFFTTANWSHSFPKCAGGDAFHTDYWL